MKTLLIYPEFPDTFWSFKHALKFIRKRAASPPLGLITVASLLPTDWSKKLVDTNVERLKDSHLAWADVALIGGMNVQRDSARRIIARCKAAGLKVIAGGPMFTAEHEHFPEVDHFVLDEAELSLPPFLEDFQAGSASRVYRANGFADLSQTPAPMWSLAKLDRYAEMSLQYSRGCPFNCEFCNVTALFGKKPRVKDAPQMIAELDGLHEAGWRGRIFFVDDNLIGNKKRFKNELLPPLIDWQNRHPHTPFQTEASINLADDEAMMKGMVEAGFDTVFVGIETPDEETLNACGKQQNSKRNLQDSVRIIQRAGMQVQAGFIVGFDSDEPNIFQRQIEFIRQTGIVTAMVGLLNAPAGTPLYERMKAEGRLKGEMGNNVSLDTNIIPRMNLDALVEGYRTIMRELYTPREYYDRIRTFLKDYPVPKINAPFQWTHIVAFVRSLVHLGLWERGGRHYLKLLAWCLRHNRAMLPMAVSLAISGYHFRKICRLHIWGDGPVPAGAALPEA